MADETTPPVAPAADTTVTNVGDAVTSVLGVASAVVSVAFPQAAALMLVLNISKQLFPNLYPSLIALFKSQNPTPEQMALLLKEEQLLLNPGQFYQDQPK